MSSVKRYPGECDKEDPGPFVVIPPQPKEKKPGQLSEEQLRQYFEEGYCKVDNFFTPEDLDPCRKEIEELVEDLAQRLHKAGKIKNLYKECGLYQRLTMLNKEFPGANIVLHKLGILPKTFRKIWSNKRMLNIVEQLLGTQDIKGHPVWNLRTKTPHNEEVTVPWHQDNGYMSVDAYHSHVVTAWIPLLDANENNGCMQIARNGHRKGRVARHTCCAGGTWYILLEPEEMEKTLDINLEKDVMTMPVNYGSFLLFNNMTPHRSLDNKSNDIRWSMDLRWYRGSDPTGFFGVKDGIRMRNLEQGDDYVITDEDWANFDGVNRHTTHDCVEKDKAHDEFDTTIPGPWMKKWELVHMNRHVEAMLADGQDDSLLVVG